VLEAVLVADSASKRPGAGSGAGDSSDDAVITGSTDESSSAVAPRTSPVERASSVGAPSAEGEGASIGSGRDEEGSSKRMGSVSDGASVVEEGVGSESGSTVCAWTMRRGTTSSVAVATASRNRGFMPRV